MNRILIKDVCDVYDGPHATPKKLCSGPIYLGIDAITDDGQLNPSSFSYLSEDDYKIWTRRVTPVVNDIVFSYEATLGRYALIPDGFYGCLGRRLAIVRVKDNKINPKWLYYYFKSPEWNSFIKSKVIKGSTVNRISVEDFPEYSIPNVPRNEQDRIVAILSLIDEKIDNNTKLNDNLHRMAYETYMHLFFKKQATGSLVEIIKENPKSSVQVGEAKCASGAYPFFTSGDAILEWDDFMVDGRNCFLNTGGNAGVKFYIGEAAYSTDTWCITAKQNMADYLYLLLSSIELELNQKFFQGTGLKHLQKPLLKDRMIYIPTEQELNEFNSKVQPIMNIISANSRENKRLLNLRDWLLPMLMNGQVTVLD